MRRLVLAVCLLATACGGDDDDPRPTGPIGYSVRSYDYAFDLESRAAATIVTMEVTEGGDCIDIPLRAHQLADVHLGGEPITSGGVETGVLTACGAGWESGLSLELSATMVIPDETWEDSQVGYSVSVDAEDNPFTYLVSWLGGCDRFGPCDSAPDRFATYRFTVDHPAGTLVTCPGRITPGQTQTTCEFDYAGGPTYSTFGVAASPSWSVAEVGLWDGSVAVSLYDSPSTGATARFDAPVHQQFFEWMTATFGPYPYGDELRILVAPTYWGGFEHPGNIVLSDSLSAGGQRQTLHHELVHMWAGDRTTLADIYDFAWKEAIANYLPLVFEEENVSASNALSMARSYRNRALGVDYHLVPGERPSLLEFYGDVYSPGPMILFRQLEALFDRQTVMSALQTFLSDNRAASMSDLKTALEAATGADLTNYFDVWVYGTGVPEYPQFEVSISDAGAGNVDVTVSQVAPTDRTFGCAFNIRLTGAAGETHDVWIDRGVDGELSTVVTTTPGFAVTGYVFDTGVHCVATDVTSTPAARPPRSNPFLAPVPPRPW